MEKQEDVKQEIEHLEEDAGKGLKKGLRMVRKASKRTKIIIGIILVIILIIVGWAFFRKSESPYIFAQVERGDVIEQVSATGTAEAAAEVDLRFKTSGIIQSINVRIGQQVYKGTYLARISSGEVQSQYAQAQASYNQAKAKLDQLLAGATTEEINVAQQVAENAQIALDDAQAKADNDLNQDYNSALVYLINASSKCNKAVADLKDIEKEYFYRSAPLDNTYADKRASAESNFSEADEYVDEAIANQTHGNIDLALTGMRLSTQKVINALDYAKTAMADPAVREDVAAADKTVIDADITNVNTAYSNINTAQTDIANQKITNQVNINTAQSTLDKAKADLEELKAPPRNVDTAIYQADVEKYRANMNEFSQKLRDASIIAPFSGIVAKIDGKIGEVVSANDKVIVSLVSPGNFQVRADITEADISKLDLEDPVEIILDAFPEEKLIGQVVEIEPGETIIEGVVYYRIKILFEEVEEKVKSGMTADVTIETDKKQGVLFVPQRAIVYSDEVKFVRILKGKEIKEIAVETGLRGSAGEIEIISGLNEGQEVITFIKK